jgi:polyisoprenoid-binding protein YceI
VQVSDLVRLVEGRRLPIAGEWAIDPGHTCAGFAVRHMLTLMRGRFTDLAGTITIADDPLESSVEVTIQVASLHTGNPRAEEALLGERFLEVDRFPTITFASTGVQPAEDGRWTVSGELTVHGVTWAIELDTEFLGAATNPMGGQAKMGFEARSAIDREDYGLHFTAEAPDSPGVFVMGSRIDLTLDVEANLIAAAARPS